MIITCTITSNISAFISLWLAEVLILILSAVYITTFIITFKARFVQIKTFKDLLSLNCLNRQNSTYITSDE